MPRNPTTDPLPRPRRTTSSPRGTANVMTAAGLDVIKGMLFIFDEDVAGWPSETVPDPFGTFFHMNYSPPPPFANIGLVPLSGSNFLWYTTVIPVAYGIPNRFLNGLGTTTSKGVQLFYGQCTVSDDLVVTRVGATQVFKLPWVDYGDDRTDTIFGGLGGAGAGGNYGFRHDAGGEAMGPMGLGYNSWGTLLDVASGGNFLFAGVHVSTLTDPAFVWNDTLVYVAWNGTALELRWQREVAGSTDAGSSVLNSACFCGNKIVAAIVTTENATFTPPLTKAIYSVYDYNGTPSSPVTFATADSGASLTFESETVHYVVSLDRVGYNKALLQLRLVHDGFFSELNALLGQDTVTPKWAIVSDAGGAVSLHNGPILSTVAPFTNDGIDGLDGTFSAGDGFPTMSVTGTEGQYTMTGANPFFNNNAGMRAPGVNSSDEFADAGDGFTFGTWYPQRHYWTPTDPDEVFGLLVNPAADNVEFFVGQGTWGVIRVSGNTVTFASLEAQPQQNLFDHTALVTNDGGTYHLFGYADTPTTKNAAGVDLYATGTYTINGTTATPIRYRYLTAQVPPFRVVALGPATGEAPAQWIRQPNSCSLQSGAVVFAAPCMGTVPEGDGYTTTYENAFYIWAATTAKIAAPLGVNQSTSRATTKNRPRTVAAAGKGAAVPASDSSGTTS